MLINKYIEKAEKKAGTQKELAKILGITTSYLRNAKAGKSGLPDYLCIKIADYIEADRLEIIAASNLVTEKDEERRRIFESCFTKTSKAASFIIAALLISVLTIMTPSTANASPVRDTIAEQYILC